MAVIAAGSLVAALEVTAHAVDPNKDVLRPSSGIAPAAVYDKPRSATGSTTTTRPAAKSGIGSSVVVIIGQPSASTRTTRQAPTITATTAP